MFDPDEARKEIEALFKEFNIKEVDEDHEVQFIKPKEPIRPEDLTKEMILQSREKALEEIALIKQAFIEFQRQTANCVLPKYMELSLASFVGDWTDLEMLIRGRKRSNVVTFFGAKEVKDDQELLGLILARIYNHYFNR